eukprot:1161115-Pelagomonas_calceolata.AAC.2
MLLCMCLSIWSAIGSVAWGIGGTRSTPSGGFSMHVLYRVLKRTEQESDVGGVDTPFINQGKEDT